MCPRWIKPPPQWDVALLTADAAGVLKEHAATLRAEQATGGLDDLDELELHALLAEGLGGRGYQVQREVHYPAGAQKRTPRRQRCDLVLGRPDVADLPLLWLEVKRSWQFEEAEVHRGYSAQLMQNVVRDIRKLRADEGIQRAALLLVAYACDEATLLHDLAAFESVCDRKGAPLHPGHEAHFPILDRIGHSIVAAACWRVR